MISSDAVLIAKIREHDVEAFETLAERYRMALYRHVAQMLHDAAAAEDIVQEVLLRLWTRAEQWQGHDSCQGWLLRIATNLALNHLRTIRRHSQQPLELPADPFDDTSDELTPAWMIDTALPAPDDLVEQAERGRLLQQLIEGLPAEKREVFRLVHDAEMEAREVAETLGIPVGTVKSRLHYANKQLAREWKLLAKEWEDLA